MDAPPVYRRPRAARSGEAPVAAAIAEGGLAPESSEAALPPDVYFRAAVIGVALAVLATALATLLALLIVTGPFHTALGDIG